MPASRTPSAALAVAATGLRLVQAVGPAAEAWLDLATRIWLAQAFLAGAVMVAMTGTPPTMADAGGAGAMLNDLVASPFGLLTQTLCPVLLLLGLGSRLTAAALLIQVLALRGPGAGPVIHLSWSLLLGWMIVRGPGIYSLDALFAQGLDCSAVPGARTLRRVCAAITRHVGRWYALGLRLWVAGVLLAVAGVPWPLLHAARGPFLRAASSGGLSGHLGMLSPGVAVLIGVLLMVGLGTRVSCLVLILAIPFGQRGMALDDRTFWAVLLGIAVCRGAEFLAVDRLVARALQAIGERMLGVSPSLPHVVILGGGFGGLAAARGLRHAPCRITLVDRNNHHVFQPLLYQVATAGLSPAAIATPIRSLFRAQPNLRVLLADVQGVAADSAEVLLDRGRLGFDYLVVATGARHSYFGRDEWAAAAPGLKRIEDATEIRRRILTAFERAEGTEDPAARECWMTFVIVGGGPTGVELAGTIAELARHGMKHDFRAIDPATARIVLVQSAERLLPTFAPSLSADARDQLRRLAVEVLTGAKVDEIGAAGVVVGGTRIEARTVLWAAGVTASPAGAWLGAPIDKAGRVKVGPDLSVTAGGRIFAIGDTAASTGWNGGAVPGLAPAAKQGGRYVARVIRARLTGRPAPRPFRYRHPGSLATIGRRAAVAEFGPVKLRGALAWWVWGVVHILFLAGGRNRLAVMLDWSWAYLTYRRTSRLITASRPTGLDPA